MLPTYVYAKVVYTLDCECPTAALLSHYNTWVKDKMFEEARRLSKANLFTSCAHLQRLDSAEIFAGAAARVRFGNPNLNLGPKNLFSLERGLVPQFAFTFYVV